jgi:Tol biopolymer transport system component
MRTLLTTIVLITAAPLPAQEAALRIAFASYRDRPQHPQVFFYEHDGVSQGRLSGGIPTIAKRSDHHPVLSADGQLCALAVEQEGQPCTIQIWDVESQKLAEFPALNETPNAQAAPTLSLDNRLLAFESWSRPGSPGRWDLQLYDLHRKGFVDLALNTATYDERNPALSGDGRRLAYTSNDSEVGLTDIRLYDLDERRPVPLPQLNSPHMDTEPSLSADGRWLAFVSDRPGGVGGRDVYLYDVAASRLEPLPGLNSPGQEQSPGLSPDGRFLVFVSERLSGAGERDLFLYDRQTSRLLATPGLNSNRDDIDPMLAASRTPAAPIPPHLPRRPTNGH